MAKIDFGGVIEDVVTSEEFPLKKAKEILANETVAVLGYGVQGPAQSLNMRDNGINVIVGQRKEEKIYWDKAVKDGFKPGKTLFPLEDAAEKGTIIQMLVSDAGQMAIWPKIKGHLNEGDALYFSHGFSILLLPMYGMLYTLYPSPCVAGLSNPGNCHHIGCIPHMHLLF